MVLNFILNSLFFILLFFFLSLKKSESLEELLPTEEIIAYKFSDNFLEIYTLLIFVLILNISTAGYFYYKSIENSLSSMKRMEKISQKIPVWTTDGRVGLIKKQPIKVLNAKNF